MSVLDRVVMALAPERGLRRLKNKMAGRALMNYDAATTGRRTFGWASPATDANTAGQSRARLRYLSRDFIRNRALAVRGRDVITGNVVGTGVVPAPRYAERQDQDIEKRAAEVVRAHFMTSAIDVTGAHALPALQAVIMNAVFSDGEVLVRRRMVNLAGRPELQLPFQIEILEADFLDERVTKAGKNEVIDGIEIDGTGRPVAYHLLTAHPGNARALSARTERVPAADILHIRRLDRPGQMRGVPWLAPVMLTLGELSDFQEATNIKHRMAALMTFFVEAADDGEVYGTNSQIEEAQPGAIVGLKPGQKVNIPSPVSADGYEEVTREGIRRIATALGLTYESFGDLQGVNFSSGRMGRMEMDRAVQVWQQNLMINQLGGGLARWALEGWTLAQSSRGLPPRPDALDWTAPRRPLIDPVKEINAAAREIEVGLTSTSRKQREFGLDPDRVHEERLQDARRLRDLEGQNEGNQNA